MIENICVEEHELDLRVQLFCGQSFRWIQTSNEEFTSEINGHLVTLSQLPGTLQIESEESCKADVFDYFQLQVNLQELYEQWSSCPNFKKKGSLIRGVRMLRQSPVETIFAFICSQNNHISRISKMVLKLSSFGKFLGSRNGSDIYRFPEPKEILENTTEQHLKDAGFGYRAKYVMQTAKQLSENLGQLEKLRSKTYDECYAFLIELSGVGPKVADCICLMSLDKNWIVPVDTHVYNIAKRDYGFSSVSKGLSKVNYGKIRDLFKNVFGEYAGWAHSILFTADLKPKKNK